MKLEKLLINLGLVRKPFTLMIMYTGLQKWMPIVSIIPIIMFAIIEKELNFYYNPYTVYSRYKKLIGASEFLILYRISLISKRLNIISPIGAVGIININLYLISNFP